jgi:hypothetical protein
MAGGQVDERPRTVAAEDDMELRTDLRKAYERGRLDERSGRRRHPILMTLTFILAVVGVVLLVLAAAGGSFEAGGRIADQGLSAAVSRAGPAAHQAAAGVRSSAGTARSATSADEAG